MRRPLDVDQALAFAAHHPMGHLDESLRRRLLTELTSAPQGTLALRDADGALALVATVVDVIADPSAPAELVVLGARPGVAGVAFVEAILAPARQFARSVGRRALHVARPDFLPDAEEVLVRAGFVRDHEIVLMRRAAARLHVPEPILPANWRWVPLDEALVASAHAALGEIFRDTPTLTLPPLEAFRRGAFSSQLGWQVLLHKEEITGLVRLSATETSGQVRVLGRAPRYRGRGLGPLLLAHALRQLEAAGAREVTLEVAATNERALGLYRTFDFEILERTPIFSASV